MNELLFFLHALFVLFFLLIALRLGKEALLSFFVLEAVIANLFVTKEICCFGMTITCTDVFAIGSLFTLNLLQELYGKSFAKKGTYIASFLLLFFILMSQIHLRYFPSSFDTKQNAFDAILSTSPRIIVSSLIVLFLSQRLDIQIYSWLKKWKGEKHFLLRFGTSALISQFFDTLLFSFLALYGTLHSLFDIIVMSYLVKVIIIFTMSPFTLLCKRLVFRRAPT